MYIFSTAFHIRILGMAVAQKKKSTAHTEDDNVESMLFCACVSRVTFTRLQYVTKKGF